ncbi:MAG: hypothetical protein LC650_03640, partial [Actinobacteria bacterium]|nr:hypothetical protein [Actinomycetota bacterium]
TNLATQTDDQTAAEVSFASAGDLASTNVQDALEELDAEKLALAGGTMTGAINMDGNAITDAGSITGTTITGTTLTDGTLSINAGSITGAVSIGTGSLTATGVISGGTLTDGTASISSGAITGVTDLTATGTITAGTLTDGSFSVNSGAVTGVSTLSASGAVTVGSVITTGTVDGRDVSDLGTDVDDLVSLTGQSANVTDFGTTTFTEGIIPDASNITTALQSLETNLATQTDDQTAAEVSFTPAGDLASTNVQDALEELDTEKLALAGGTMTGAINMGGNAITNAGAITGTTITGTTLTDGILSINAGAITGAVSIGTGSLTATGIISGGTLTDGTASISSGAITGVTDL